LDGCILDFDTEKNQYRYWKPYCSDADDKVRIDFYYDAACNKYWRSTNEHSFEHVFGTKKDKCEWLPYEGDDDYYDDDFQGNYQVASCLEK
jgi:hypothetical protein